MSKLRETAAFVFVDEQEDDRKIRLIFAELDYLEGLADGHQVDFINRNSRDGLQIKFGVSARANHLENIKADERLSYTELQFTVF